MKGARLVLIPKSFHLDVEIGSQLRKQIQLLNRVHEVLAFNLGFCAGWWVENEILLRAGLKRHCGKVNRVTKRAMFFWNDKLRSEKLSRQDAKDGVKRDVLCLTGETSAVSFFYHFIVNGFSKLAVYEIRLHSDQATSPLGSIFRDPECVSFSGIVHCTYTYCPGAHGADDSSCQCDGLLWLKSCWPCREHKCAESDANHHGSCKPHPIENPFQHFCFPDVASSGQTLPAVTMALRYAQ